MTVPGFPRGRLRSRPEEEPAPEHVYQILAEHGERIAGIESSQQKFEIGQATMLVKLESIAQTDRHATTKLIIGLVTTAITVIGGQRLLAPSPMPTSTPMTRSALDVRLDICRAMAPGSPSREDCVSRVTQDTEH